MNALLDAFWKICIFRLNPQDLPTSTALLYLSALLYALLNAVVASLNLSLGPALMSAVVDVLLITGLTWLVLWVRDLGPRFSQTVTALMGTGAIIGLVAMPLVWWQTQVGLQGSLIPSFLMLCVLLWSLAVVGHILRHALNTPLFVGVLIAVLYMYVSINIIRVLFVAPI